MCVSCTPVETFKIQNKNLTTYTKDLLKLQDI